MSERDSLYMMRAIELARRAEGRTSPNPMVGCVLVHEGKIVGEGWHQGPGTPHAEVAAIEAAPSLAKGATAYVTLEPCNHHGSTPPCSGALIRAGVARVVYGVSDENPIAAGGAVALRSAGIQAVRLNGEAAQHAEDLMRPWLFWVKSNRPYIYLKWAGTLDGRMATPSGESKWITGPMARLKGHELRQRTDAILVGINTVLADDPSLDPRPEGKDPAPSMKVVLDSQLRCPATAKLLTSPGKVIVYSCPDADPSRAEALRGQGAEVVSVPVIEEGLSLPEILTDLKAKGVVSLMVEGGGTVLGEFVDRGLFDEVWSFLAPKIMGGGKPVIKGKGVPTLEALEALSVRAVEQVGTDIFICGQIERGV